MSKVHDHGRMASWPYCNGKLRNSDTIPHHVAISSLVRGSQPRTHSPGWVVRALGTAASTIVSAGSGHRSKIHRHVMERETSEKVRRLFKRGFCRHSTAACMVWNPMELRYFAGPAAIILVDGEISRRERDAYTAWSFHYCLCNNAHRPQHSLEVYNSRESRVSTHVIRYEVH